MEHFNELKKLPARELGRQMMRGACSYLADAGLVWLCLMVIYMVIRNSLALGTDSTDASGWARSGLTVLTDAKTGVEYLSDGKGGLCVRVTAPVASK